LLLFLDHDWFMMIPFSFMSYYTGSTIVFYTPSMTLSLMPFTTIDTTIVIGKGTVSMIFATVPFSHVGIAIAKIIGPGSSPLSLIKITGINGTTGPRKGTSSMSDIIVKHAFIDPTISPGIDTLTMTLFIIKGTDVTVTEKETRAKEKSSKFSPKTTKTNSVSLLRYGREAKCDTIDVCLHR
jgi:hypothetical protein